MDINKYIKYVLKNITSRTLLHLRLASFGKPSIKTTHPFHHLGYYWAHNGIAHVDDEIAKLQEKNYTDSYIEDKTLFEEDDHDYDSLYDTYSNSANITDTELFIKKIQKIEPHHINDLANRYLSGVIYALSKDTKKLIIVSQKEHYYACIDSKMHILSSQKDILDEINDTTKIKTTVKKIWRLQIPHITHVKVCKTPHKIKIQKLPPLTQIVKL